MLARNQTLMVICDLNMPGVSGFDFISQVKSDPALKTTPVIVYSASESPRDTLPRLFFRSQLVFTEGDDAGDYEEAISVSGELLV